MSEKQSSTTAVVAGKQFHNTIYEGERWFGAVDVIAALTDPTIATR